MEDKKNNDQISGKLQSQAIGSDESISCLKANNSELTLARTIISEKFGWIEKREDNEDSSKIYTGFHELDKLTGGFQKSDFIILASRPSMGKSILSLNIALENAIKRNIPVIIFSMEMPEKQLIQRMLGAMAEIDSQLISNRTQLVDNDWLKLSNAVSKLNSAPLYIDDTPGITFNMIKSKVRKLKYEQQKPELIIIDYIQLMEGERTFCDRVQEISTISRGLKSLAREIDGPVIALSQLSRAVEQRQNKRPMLSDLRESGSMEQDADIIMLIYRDEYYYPEKEENKGDAEIIVVKQRKGPTGTLNLLFNPSISKFSNLINNK